MAFLLDPSPSAADFPQELMSQPVLRFYMDMTPGMGHQTHTATIMRRFREAGYRGRMEVVFYHDSSNEKLGILFPGYRPSRPSVQEDLPNRLRFYHFEYSKFFEDPGEPTPDLLEPILYTISGGNDRQMTRWSHFLNERMKTKYLITINPPSWANDSHVQFENGGTIDMPEVRDSSTLESSWLWSPSERDDSLIQRLGALKASALVIPAYPSSKKVNEMLPRLLRGLASAATGKTVVLPLVGDFGSSWIADFMKKNSDLHGVAMWTELSSLIQGKINIVPIPKLTPPTFSHVFSKMQFPLVIISGRNSINLAVRSGQPFLGSEGPTESSYAALNMAVEPHWKDFVRAHEALLKSHGSPEFLEGYVRQIFDGHAGLLDFHSRLAVSTVSQNPLDHVQQGLNLAIDIIRRVEAGRLCPVIATGSGAPAWQ